AVLLRQLGGVRAVEADPATLELLELHDLHERGRLPAARLADKREALALMDVEGDAVYRALLPDLPAQHHALGDREDPLELLDLEDLRRLGVSVMSPAIASGLTPPTAPASSASISPRSIARRSAAVAWPSTRGTAESSFCVYA